MFTSLKPYPHKIKNRITDVIRFFMVDLNVQDNTLGFAKPYIVLLWAHIYSCIFLEIIISKFSSKKCISSNQVIAWKLKINKIIKNCIFTHKILLYQVLLNHNRKKVMCRKLRPLGLLLHRHWKKFLAVLRYGL